MNELRYVIDFESTFSTENSLTTKTNEEYVRSPLFEAIGMGVYDLQTDDADWLTSPMSIDFALKDFCARGAGIICHHTHHDGFIVSQHYRGYQPTGRWYDTLSMARGLYPRLRSHSLDALVEHFHLGAPKTVPYNLFRGKSLEQIKCVPGLIEQIGEGCLHDCKLTAELFKLLIKHMPERELDLIDLTIRLYTDPVLVGDPVVLEEALTEAIIERDSWPARLGIDKKVLVSDKKFASLLTGHGVTPPTKISPRTGKDTFAFAKGDLAFQTLREHPDGKVRDLIEARIACKTSIDETRAARLLGMSERGPIPVYLRYYGAHTGRFSGGDKVNLQNLPRGTRLRNGLRAPPGHVLVWADLAQIECRIVASLAGCEPLTDAFRAGRDVYSEFGTDTFQRVVSKKDNPELRFISKTTILGCGYGMGLDRLHLDLEIKGKREGIEVTREQSRVAHTGFRTRYREIPELWKRFDQTLNNMYNIPGYTEDCGSFEVCGKFVILPNGMYLDYEDLHWDTTRNGWKAGGRNLWGGSFTENITQALARVVLTDAWLQLEDAGVPIVLNVHDELIACVPLANLSPTIATFQAEMVRQKYWLPDLPLAVEVNSGERYEK